MSEYNLQITREHKNKIDSRRCYVLMYKKVDKERSIFLERCCGRRAPGLTKHLELYNLFIYY